MTVAAFQMRSRCVSHGSTGRGRAGQAGDGHHAILKKWTRIAKLADPMGVCAMLAVWASAQSLRVEFTHLSLIVAVLDVQNLVRRLRR